MTHTGRVNIIEYHRLYNTPSPVPSTSSPTPDCHGHEMEMFDNNAQQSTMFCNVKAMWMYCKSHQLFIKGSWNTGKILNFSSSFINCLPPDASWWYNVLRTEFIYTQHLVSCFQTCVLVRLSPLLPSHLNTSSLSVGDNVINHYAFVNTSL